MSRTWPAVAVLCVAAMTGAAACTSSPPHEAAAAAQSASDEPSTAESAMASPTPATSSAAPSQPSPAQVATTATAKTTKKPTTSAPRTTTAAGAPAAPADVRITSVDLLLLDTGRSGPCDPTLPVKMMATVHFSYTGFPFPGKIQVHSSDGHDPAPVSFNGRGSALTVNLSASITVNRAQLQRTVDFWVETLEPNRVTSARSTYRMNCFPPANALS